MTTVVGCIGDALLTFPGEEEDLKKLQELLKEFSDKNPDVKVLFAQGLEVGLFPNASPTKAFIEEVVPNRPVVMLSATEHEGLLNSKALAMEGITADTPSPKGGEIVKDSETGEPTGFLKENAAGRWAWKHYPDVSPEEHKKGLQGTITYLNSVGITSVKQQHAKNPIAIAAQSLEKDGDLHARIALSWTWKGPLESMPLDEQEKMIADRGRFASDLIKTEFVKISLDGNAGSTGYVVDPYLVTKDKGLPVYPNDEDLFVEVEKFELMGLGITVHATGDAANRQMMDALDKVKKKHGKLLGRHQLGHATLIHPDDIPRMKALDLTAEFSPVFWYPSAFPEIAADFDDFCIFVSVCAGSGTLIEGIGETGDFNATCGSDDSYWSAHGASLAFAVTDPVVQFELFATAPAEFGGNSISIEIEAHKDNGRLNVRALLFNFTTARYVALPGIMPLENTDTVMTFDLPVGSNAEDFVDTVTDEVWLLLQTIQTAGPANARTQLDQVLFFFDVN